MASGDSRMWVTMAAAGSMRTALSRVRAARGAKSASFLVITAAVSPTVMRSGDSLPAASSAMRRAPPTKAFQMASRACRAPWERPAVMSMRTTPAGADVKTALKPALRANSASVTEQSQRGPISIRADGCSPGPIVRNSHARRNRITSNSTGVTSVRLRRIPCV